MTKDEAFAMIKDALAKSIKKPFEITPETDLIGEEILDSLDGMVFILELENMSGHHFPEDIDLVKEGYFTVPKLIEQLTA